MCFGIKKGMSCGKIATEDIICYKTFDKNDLYDDGFVSLRMRYKHKFDELCPDVFLRVNNAYATASPSRYQYIDEGYHVHKNYSEAKRLCFYSRNIIMCYIPKGSEYYENDKEYVSESLYIMDKSYMTNIRLFNYFNVRRFKNRR